MKVSQIKVSQEKVSQKMCHAAVEILRCHILYQHLDVKIEIEMSSKAINCFFLLSLFVDLIFIVVAFLGRNSVSY